jgi:methionyl-tRNA formyltransferase
MKIRLYFLGSGEIAVPVIDRICKSDKFELLGLGTQKDKFAGRNKALLPTAVSVWAEKNNIITDKLLSLNNSIFTSKLKKLKPDIILVVSFGQILKEDFLKIPNISCINVHASLLPKYRGASPIAAAILNADKETGVCFMKMEKGLDNGPIYKEIKMSLYGNEYADELELALGKLAAENVEEVLCNIFSGKMYPKEQDHSKASYVGKINKSDGMIDWNMSAVEIERKIRAFCQWPGAYFYINTLKGPKKINITGGEVLKNLTGMAGEVIKADRKTGLIIACGNGALKIISLIPEGKKEMSSEDFLLGTKVEEGSFVN